MAAESDRTPLMRVRSLFDETAKGAVTMQITDFKKTLHINFHSNKNT